MLTRGDTASIPAGVEHSYRGDGHYTKVLTMSTPGGLEKLIATAGDATTEHIFGAPGALDLDALREAAAASTYVSSDDRGRRSARRWRALHGRILLGPEPRGRSRDAHTPGAGRRGRPPRVSGAPDGAAAFSRGCAGARHST